MGVALKTEIEGLKEAQRKTIQAAKELRGGAIFGAVRTGTVTVMRDAMIYTAVRTGRLRAGWNLTIAQNGPTVIGVVFNPVEYAPYYEFGLVTRKYAARRPLGRSVAKNRDLVVALIIDAVRRSLA